MHPVDRQQGVGAVDVVDQLHLAPLGGEVVLDLPADDLQLQDPGAGVVLALVAAARLHDQPGAAVAEAQEGRLLLPLDAQGGGVPIKAGGDGLLVGEEGAAALPAEIPLGDQFGGLRLVPGRLGGPNRCV